MAESKKRKKNGHEVEDDLLWVVVFYISQGVYPIPKIGQWNIAVGLGTMMVGFLMTLRWR